MPLKVAREKATGIIATLAVGISEAEKRRELRRESTLGDLWQLFFTHHAKVRKRSWRTDAKRWKCHLAQHAHLPLSKVTTPRISQWLTTITANSGPGAANRVRALLMTMFNVGRRQFGLRIPNPVEDTHRAPERPKDRYLAPDERQRFLRALEQHPSPDARDFYTVALLTGQRAGTIAGTRWCDLNLQDAVWQIPAENMKAGRPLVVPLARTVVALLRRRREMATSAEYVFPSAVRTSGHIEPPRHAWPQLLASAGIETPTTPHDLRRTFATVAVEAGVGLGEIARLLGHTPAGGVTAVYARIPMSTLQRAVEKIEQAMLATGTATAEKVLAFPTA